MVDEYRGDAGNAFGGFSNQGFVSNRRMFTTVDSDNDVSADNNCAVNQKGAGWWYCSSCCSSSTECFI